VYAKEVLAPICNRSLQNRRDRRWNAGDQSARILEIISPGGFEKFFRELAS